MLDVVHSILQYSWRAMDYTIFVRYLLGTAYLPAPADIFAYHFFATIVPKPEKTVYIDIEPDVACRRIQSRTQDALEMFEKPEALRKMRQKGLTLASLGKWKIIFGNRGLEEVESDIHRVLGIV
jgi:thymidylate kinase